MNNWFYHYSLLSLKIDFSLFLLNHCFFDLPISINFYLVSFDNSSGVNLETILYKWSFSVENWLDSTPIEEGYEDFYYYYNSGNVLIIFIPLVPFLNKVENKSVWSFSWIKILFQWNNGCCFFSGVGVSL